jgi:hypothetical protein
VGVLVRLSDELLAYYAMARYLFYNRALQRPPGLVMPTAPSPWETMLGSSRGAGEKAPELPTH